MAAGMGFDMGFAVAFAKAAGAQMVALRTAGTRRKKLDRTDVTDADERINASFIRAVQRREGRGASVLGEERSLDTGSSRVWIIDPVDGTGEYIDDSIVDSQRTTCTGIALMVRGELALSVVYNPFRRELFTAQAGRPSQLNGRILTCSSAGMRRNAYDYAHWDGARFDLRGLQRQLGKPIGHYSAIYQACTVATARSSFAAFPGNTIHDIAPGALVVAGAAGRVTDLWGRPLDWSNLNQGALYASRTAHAEALRAVAAVL